MTSIRPTFDSDCNDWRDSTAEFKSQCLAHGFPLVGITDLLEPPRYRAFESWLERGFAGSMTYIEKRKNAYRHASSVMEGCKRIVMLGIPYSKTVGDSDETKDGGKVARYASATVDYHDLIHSKLKSLRSWLERRYAGAAVRGVVDTAPLLEREFANLAGIGWIGKNTLLLTKSHGSNFFLAALLTDIPFEIDSPFEADHCGTCRACLDACPTSAFPEPYVLDATRCISYLTIEHRGPIPSELQERVQDWVFGCDVCQEVCPWNRRPSPLIESPLQSQKENNRLPIVELLQLTPDSFRERFRKSPLKRPKLEGILRNAAVVAANLKIENAVPELQALAETSTDSTVREAAIEALKRISP